MTQSRLRLRRLIVNVMKDWAEHRNVVQIKQNKNHENIADCRVKRRDPLRNLNFIFDLRFYL